MSHCNWDLSSESYEEIDSANLKDKIKNKHENILLKKFREYQDDCEEPKNQEAMQCSCECATCKGPEGCCQVLCPDCRNYQPNLIFIPYAYPLVVPGPSMDQQPNNTNPDTILEQTENNIIQFATASNKVVTTNTPSTPYNMVLRNVDSTSPTFSVTMPTAVDARPVKRNKKINNAKVRFLLSARELHEAPVEYELYNDHLNENYPDVSNEGEEHMKAVKVRPLVPINNYE